MPYPIAPPATALARFFLVLQDGLPVPITPAGSDSLSIEPGEDNGIGPFYYRKKLAGPLILVDADYRLLLAREQSTHRCQPVGLVVETRASLQAAWQTEYVGTFTCSECDWDLDRGTVGIKPTTDDAYRPLLEAWDIDYNLLAVPDSGPARRRVVTAQLTTLAGNTKLEFLLTNSTEQGDYIGTDGWTTFLTNTSPIPNAAGFGGTASRDVIIFRYRQVGVKMLAGGGYLDKSATGWSPLLQSQRPDPNGGTDLLDYVKSPEIAGFKPYQIRQYRDWNDPLLAPGGIPSLNRQARYGTQLLLLPCDRTPADYGFVTSDYLKVSGGGSGVSLGGAQNDDHAPCLNVRKEVETDNLKSLWWKFGEFAFTRCIPLLEAIHGLLKLTIAGPPPAVGELPAPVPAALSALLPPSASQLSSFFSDATNPATGETGDANELPRLQVAAASDVKRYGASEPATRLLINLKAFLADLGALYDVGAFVDPATGWLRIEHRSYLAGRRMTGTVLDLTAVAQAVLPRAYTYRQQQLPRFEELTVANGSTEDVATGISFRTAAIRYASDCANPREGQNRTTRNVSRLTGDVAALVLSGDAIPDNAVALLAPNSAGRLADANSALAPTLLLRRYHREGRVRAAGASVGTVPLLVSSTRPGLEQAECSAPLGTLRGLDAATTQLITSLGSGAIVGKATLSLKTGIVKLTPWLPTPEPTAPEPASGRQFTDQFSDQFA